MLGVLAGMRSMAAPAVLGRLSRAGELEGLSGPLALVTTSGFAATANLLTAGELVADKLPVTPNRTAAGPLLGRALTGGLAGAALFSAQKQPAAVGALIGAGAAVGASYAALALRRAATKKLGWRDGFVALAEDAIVGAIGFALVSRLRVRT